MNNSLFGEDFEITIKKPNIKELVKKVSSTQETEKDVTKILKSSKVSLQDRLHIITENVYKVLGKYRKNVLVIKDKQTLHDYISAAIEAKEIAIDTETNNSLDPVTCRLMGPCFYYPGGKQAYVPLNHINPETKERLEWQVTEADIKEELQRLVDAKTYMIYHNGKFDYEVIKCTCDIALPVDWDTMIGARLLNENELAGLKFQYRDKIDKNQSKYDIENLFDHIQYSVVDPDIFALYAATDSFMTYELYKYQKAIFETTIGTGPKGRGLYWVFKNIEMPIVVITAEMELTGVEVDTAFGEKLKEKYNTLLDKVDIKVEAELDKLDEKIKNWRLTKEANVYPRIYQPKKSKKIEAQLEKEFNYVDEDTGRRYKISKNSLNDQLSDPINLASPTQLAILFYDVLKLKNGNKKEPRATGKEELEYIAEEENLVLAKLLIERRKLLKLITTYIEVIPDLAKHWPDGRIRFHLNSMGTDTARYSSGGKIKYIDPATNEPVVVSGINIQNIPSNGPGKVMRNLFKAANKESIISTVNNEFKVQEIFEIKTPNGWFFPKYLKKGDIVCLTDIDTTITDILYNSTSKEYILKISVLNKQLKVRKRYRLVGSDFGAQEPRLGADLSNDKIMKEAYANNQDLYAVIAQSAFDNNYEDNLEFYIPGSEINIDGHTVVSGDDKIHEIQTEGAKFTVDYYMLIPIDKENYVQANKLLIGNKVLTEQGYFEVEKVITENKLTTIYFKEQ